MILQQIYGGNYQISLESPKFYRRPYKNILYLFSRQCITVSEPQNRYQNCNMVKSKMVKLKYSIH